MYNHIRWKRVCHRILLSHSLLLQFPRLLQYSLSRVWFHHTTLWLLLQLFARLNPFALNCWDHWYSIAVSFLFPTHSQVPWDPVLELTEHPRKTHRGYVFAFHIELPSTTPSFLSIYIKYAELSDYFLIIGMLCDINENRRIVEPIVSFIRYRGTPQSRKHRQFFDTTMSKHQIDTICNISSKTFCNRCNNIFRHGSSLRWLDFVTNITAFMWSKNPELMSKMLRNTLIPINTPCINEAWYI